MWKKHLRETWCSCSSDFHHRWCEQLHHPAVAWQKWDAKAVALHLACRCILIWKVIPGRLFFSEEKCIFLYECGLLRLYLCAFQHCYITKHGHLTQEKYLFKNVAHEYFVKQKTASFRLTSSCNIWKLTRQFLPPQKPLIWSGLVHTGMTV